MGNTAVAETKPYNFADPGQSGTEVPATMNPARMIELAIEKGAVDQLDKLLALQERWEANEARKAFVRAMADFKANRPTVYKNKEVGYNSRKAGGASTHYSHATLDNCDTVLGEHLSQVGISYSWRPKTLENNWLEITCVLTHELGHSESASMSGPPDQSGNKNLLQAMGSTKTYLERYTLLAVTGTAVKGMDDDGQGGAPDPRVQAAAEQRQANDPRNQNQGQQQDPNLVNPNQLNALRQQIQKAGTTEARFCKSAGIQSLDQLAAARFQGAMKHLNATAKAQSSRQQGAQQ